jgi:hypothetical protein
MDSTKINLLLVKQIIIKLINKSKINRKSKKIFNNNINIILILN